MSIAKTLNPTIDPVVQQRLEYLRPILGHIHSGGLRFQDGIELAFKRQALMLSESRRRLMEIGVQSGRNIESQSLRRDDLLRAFWSRSRDLHYVAHYLEPLEVEIGDIGYISGRPPRFTRLDNIYPEITGRCIPRKRFLQHQRFPSGRWTWEDVQGVVRCVPAASFDELTSESSVDTHFSFESLTPKGLRTGRRGDSVSQEIFCLERSVNQMEMAQLWIAHEHGNVSRIVRMTSLLSMLNEELNPLSLFLVCYDIASLYIH